MDELSPSADPTYKIKMYLFVLFSPSRKVYCLAIQINVFQYQCLVIDIQMGKICCDPRSSFIVHRHLTLLLKSTSF